MRGLVGGFLAPSSHLPFITFSSHFRSLGAAGSTVNSFSMKAEGGGGASYPASASSKFFPPAMIPEDVQLQIEAVYGMANPPKVALSTAGGGGHALAWLLGVPGASRCLMEAYVPYSFEAGRQWIDKGGGKAKGAGMCSMEAAKAISFASYSRAASLLCKEAGVGELGRPDGVWGIGCTATIASTRPHSGEHRAFVCLSSSSKCSCYELRMAKGARTRVEEEALVGRLIIRAIAEAAGVVSDGDSTSASGYLEGEEVPRRIEEERPNPLQQLLAGEIDRVLCMDDVMVAHLDLPLPALVFPGSFNPLHEGHTQLMSAAAAEGSSSPSALIFEISIMNADKGTLSKEEVCRRLTQFRSMKIDLPCGTALPVMVALTRAPLFVKKARLFPGCTFVMGADTAQRLVDPKYYSNSEGEMAVSLAAIQEKGCSILVGGRALNKGSFLTEAAVLSGAGIPDSLKGMFRGLPENSFRVDISSTDLRAAAAAAAATAGEG